MDSHNKVVIAALSLTVLTLALISSYLSLNQNKVLGETTGPRTQPVLPPEKKQSEVSCQEYIQVYKNYCRPITKTDSTIQAPELTEEENTSVSTTATASDNDALSLRSRVCSDLYKVGRQFCRLVIIDPRPSTACKTGVNSFTVGATCTLPSKTGPALGMTDPSQTINGASSATYVCYDGTTGVAQPKTLLAGKSCYPVATLEQMAKKACEGHSACSKDDSSDTTPSNFCTGDKDCKDGEKCIMPAATVQIVGRSLGGKCVPANIPTVSPKTTVTPSPKSCGWCGSSCTITIPGRACVQVAHPGKSCIMNSKGACQVISVSSAQ
jgi:hypothetical protein